MRASAPACISRAARCGMRGGGRGNLARERIAWIEPRREVLQRNGLHHSQAPQCLPKGRGTEAIVTPGHADRRAPVGVERAGGRQISRKLRDEPVSLGLSRGGRARALAGGTVLFPRPPPRAPAPQAVGRPPFALRIPSGP
jgi:hypothetical protein